MAVPLVLDTDIGTDVDDALALALALRHPDCELRAVTTVSGDPRLRGRIARKLVRLAGREEVEVAAGEGDPEGRHGTMGHEGEGILLPEDDAIELSERDGPAVIAAHAAAPGGVVLATVGSQSNLAATLERAPGLGRGIRRLAVMGGAFAPALSLGQAMPPSIDHNLNLDQQASLRALAAGLAAIYVPIDVTVRTFIDQGHLRRLREGDALCRALADMIDVWVPVIRRWTQGRFPEQWVSAMHDPLTVWCTLERRFYRSERVPVTVALHEGHVRTFVDHAAGTEAEVVTDVDAPAFAEAWIETVMTGTRA
jgi:purine nucleosidase